MEKSLAKRGENAPVPGFDNIAARYQAALQVVDDVILKNYITRLTDLEVVPLDREFLATNIRENVRLFKITELVYEKDESATYKFASVFTTLLSVDATVFIILDSDGEKTDFYMGVRAVDPDRTISSLKNTLRNALSGHFPGTKTQDYDTVEEIEKLLAGFKGNSIAAVSCVANSKNEDINKNQEFVQGLEKLVLSLRGQRYTGIIIANSATQQQLKELRQKYEQVYTQLSPFANMQVNFGQNSSTGRTESVSEAETRTTAATVSKSATTGTTETEGTTETTGTTVTHGTSKENTAAKVLKGVGGAASMLGLALAPFTGGTSLALGVGAMGLSLLGSAVSKTESESTSKSHSFAKSHSASRSNSQTESRGRTESFGRTYTYALGSSLTEGLSKALTLTAHDKSVEEMLARIDKQLKRMDEFESSGMYGCAAYFLSEDQYAAEAAATTYKAIMRGENSGVEIATINSWSNFEKNKTQLIGQYVKNFMHPVFQYDREIGGERIEVTPSAMVSGNELALHMGLPRKSVCGLPVIEHADFGKEVVRYDQVNAVAGINLGRVFSMGCDCSNRVFLDRSSLAMHTFVTGTTGSGKSNTIYELIRQADNLGVRFLVIEPAKGEYKHVFGNRPDVHVYSTNPEYAELLKINPFKFPHGVHVLEHVDRLVEIFNVCWPMYAAMPAVLKDALLQAYEVCGWDLSTSENAYDENLFPTFADLQNELVNVISSSAYSEEVKSNYMGSLVTRVKSLTNGLNGQIFSANEIDNALLFDKNVLIDLSRVGSLETKALIMGILIMRLGEYRMVAAEGVNVPFKHMTVLEEAHNILKRTSTEQDIEGANVAGKSVEMLANAIAEMRTYGEGFVIVDQSPTALDIAAIKNTNTKIIMRLPEEGDRRLAGKAAGLKDEQLDEIAKLPKGVAVVYQNDWVEPVLCHIQKFKGEGGRYRYQPPKRNADSTGILRKALLQLLLRNRVKQPVDIAVDHIAELVDNSEISGQSKLVVQRLLREYELRGELALWAEARFDKLSELVDGLLEGGLWLRPAVDTAKGFDELTDRVIQRIERLAPGLEGDYALAAAQCLFKAAAKAAEGYDELYAAWITHLRTKKKVM